MRQHSSITSKRTDYITDFQVRNAKLEISLDANAKIGQLINHTECFAIHSLVHRKLMHSIELTSTGHLGVRLAIHWIVLQRWPLHSTDWKTSNKIKMGAHGSKEKLSRSASERYIQSPALEHERERFGRFGKRSRGGKKKRTNTNFKFSKNS